MSWVGGKRALRDEIVKRFPLSYNTYVEVFGGAGWVLFHKNPGKDVEIFNDFNGNLVNLFRCVREKDEQLLHELEFMLNPRLDFEYMRKMIHSHAVLPDVRRAAYYYALIRYSYSSSVTSYGGRPHSMWRNFPLITAACKRLQDVAVEHKDCVDLITDKDAPETFFYCDPPYYKTEGYYEGDGFGRNDHARLAECLLSVEGKFLLSYNDCPEIRDLYNKPGISIETTTRLSNMAQRYKPGEQFPELLIANYDTMERVQSVIQFDLFNETEPQQVLEERIILQ